MSAPDTTPDDERQAYIRRLVEQAPPLSPAQRSRLGALLAPVAIPTISRKGVRHASRRA